MKLKYRISIILMLALLGSWAFQALPVLGVSEAKAQEPLPTYSRPDQPFPDPANLSKPPVAPNEVPDGAFFRSLLGVSLFVDASEINPMLPVGWSMVGNTLGVSWVFQVLNQFPEYSSGTAVTYKGVGFGLLAIDPKYNFRYYLLADFQSSASAVDLVNEVFGGGHQISRVADLKMEFESESEIDESATIKFKGEIKEPSSGLKLKVKAKFPEGPPDYREVRDPIGVDLASIDVSTSPPTIARLWRASDQSDVYVFNISDPGVELDICFGDDDRDDDGDDNNDNLLRLPGGRTIHILGVDQTLVLRRNQEGHFWFLTE